MSRLPLLVACGENMNRYVPLLGILLFALPSCSPPPTPSAPPASAPSPTAMPQSVLSQATTLFSGPGNLGYETLTELPAGTAMQLTGIYGDFVQASAVIPVGQVIGFLRKDLLPALPEGLPALDVLDVPWEPMYLPSCAPGVYDPQTDSVAFAPGESESWYSAESAAWNLETPVRVQVGKLTVNTGNRGGINVLGSRAGAENPSIWWQGVKALGIESVDGNYVLQVQDGSSEDPVASIDLERSSSEPLQIVFDQPEGKSFVVLDENNHELRQVDVTTLPGVNLPNGLFPERKFHFGIGVSGRDALVVTGLSVGTRPQGKWVEQDDIGPGLATLAEENNLIIGSVYDRSQMIDRRYCQTMQRDFNAAIVPDITWIVPGVTFWLGPGQYYFDNVDRVVEIAQQRGWRVFGSHLVWGALEAYPDWLRNGNYTREDHIKLLEQHIKSMIERYKGRIQMWSIANEAAERDFYYSKPYVYQQTQTSRPDFADFWYEKIGPEYIEMAFRWAREADPDAVLIFNSGVAPSPLTGDARLISDQMYETVKDLKGRGVPIDAIGTQMHLLFPTDKQEAPQKEAVIAYMRRYAKLGVRVYITEFEVDLGSTHGTQEERYAYQAQIYRDVMDACLESGACDGFITWGVSDSLSWVTCSQPYPNCMNEPTGDPLMFDRDFDPKPAYLAVRDALEGIPLENPVTPTSRPTTQEAISTCIAQLAGAVRQAGSDDSDMNDDFANPAYDGSFDRVKWKLSGGLLPNPIAQQQDGMLVIGNAGDPTGAAAGLTVRAYDNFTLDQPVFLEADLALCPNSSAGGVNMAINTINFEPGSWMAGCDITHLSSETWGGCTDFLWSQQTQQVEDQFETPNQPVEPGTWHKVRTEIDPATMTITYYLDGLVIGSHVPEDAETLRETRLQLVLSMWKPSADGPLLAVVDNVRIGSIAP